MPTIADDTASISYTGAGTTGPFTVPFYFLEDSHLKVIKETVATGVQTVLALTTDYSVSGAGEAAGGSITLIATISSAYRLIIERNVPYTQTASYPRNDPFPAATHERVVNKLTMLVQQLRGLFQRAPKLPRGNTLAGDDFEFPPPGAGEVIRWNAGGSALETVSLDDIGDTFTQSGTGPYIGSGPTARTWTSKVGEVFSIMDYDGSPSSSAATNASALQDLADYISAASRDGGAIRIPANAEYDIAGEIIALPANVHLIGDVPARRYDATTHSKGGSVLNFTSGDWGIRFAGRQAGVHNLVLNNDASVVYLLVVSDEGGVMPEVQNVTAIGAEYGFFFANINSGDFKIAAKSNTKIGIVFAYQNIGGHGAYAYPEIESFVSTTPSTVFKLQQHTQTNKIGTALLAGENASISGVSESNDYYGVIVFKRDGAVGDGFTFGMGGCGYFHMEDDARILSPTAWSLSNIDVLLTAAGGGNYLVGDVNGAWSSAADAYAGFFAGSATEAVNINNETVGPPRLHFAPSARIVPNGNPFRFRSQQRTHLNHCEVQSATGTRTFSQTANSTGLKIDNLRGVLDDDVALYKVSTAFLGAASAGSHVVHYADETRLKGNIATAADTAWNDIVTVTQMTLNNKFEYVIAPSAQFATYGARGTVQYDGTDVVLVEERNGSGCDVRINSGKLQYQQNSGGDINNVRWSIYPRGPVSTV